MSDEPRRQAAAPVIPRWSELTPAAQEVLWREAEDLLTRAPNRGNVPMVLDGLGKHPEAIPTFVAQMRALLDRGRS